MTSKSQIRIEDDHHNPARREGEVAMASEQSKYLVELYASIKERVSKPDIDLATNRDIVENLHLAAIEPEAVTYAEVDAGTVVYPGGLRRGPRPVAQPLWRHSRHLDAHRPKGRWAHRQGGGSPRPRAELPAFTGTQVPRSNR